MRILITAGPTREPIDAVRYLGNRSSGRMGVALAAAAREAGHTVRLLLGPVDSAVRSSVPPEVAVEAFATTAELESALAAHFPEADLLVMAAAVADYRPASVVDGKLSRGDGLRLELEATPDLVAACVASRRPGQRVVAFALEPAEGLVERAAAKLRRKGVDAIVANPLGTMENDAIDGVLLHADGRDVRPGRCDKERFAAWLVAALMN